MVGTHAIKTWSSTQDVIALSSGEAEFYGMVKGGSVGLGAISMFKDMGKPTLELNLEPSSNQNQFDFAIHKPATVAVEEFKNLLIKNIK